MVRAGIDKIADLRGKTVAVAAPGSLPNLLLKAMLEKDKVPENEVRVASLGGDLDRYKAVVAGVADAGIVAAEFMAVAPKDVRMLVRGRDALPNYVRLCLTMTGKTLRARREDAINSWRPKWTRCVSRSRIATTPSRSRAQRSGASPTIRARLTPMTTRSSTKAVDPAITLPLDKLKWMEEELVKAGNLKAPIDLAKITAPDIRDEAVKRAGK